MDTKKQNEVVVVENSDITVSSYAVAGANLAGVLAEEMEGLNITFDRIKTPIGGGTMFEMPSDDPDNPDMAKDFKAVILYHHPIHSYYKEKYTGGNTPPDCSSIDGVKGVDSDGVISDCKDCPKGQFGSGENGSKLCRQKRRLYVLRENETLPTLFSLPTTSLADFSKYIMRLLSRGKKSSAVVTKFTLKKATNAGGIAYSQVICVSDRDLTAEEVTSISTMAEQVKRFAGKAAAMEAED